MCKKSFLSVAANTVFFLIAFSGLVVISGGSLRLGGILMQKKDPENTEYALYASEFAFFIGVKSAAFFQWLTAGFIVFLGNMVISSNADKNPCKRLATIYCLDFLLLAIFGGLHCNSLPFSVRNYANCYDIKQLFVDSAATRIQNSLCDPEHSWINLAKGFSLGVSISFFSFLLLQTIYFLLRALCENQTAPRIEPADNVPEVVTNPLRPHAAIVEMTPMPLNP